MIRAWIAREGAIAATSLEEALAAHAAGVRIWVDLESEDEAEIRAALAPFQVHPLIIEDVAVHVNRPKVDVYEGMLYIVVHSARWDVAEPRPGLREVDILLGERFLVTCHDGSTRAIQAAIETLPRRPDLLARSPAVLMHHVLDVIVDHYLPITDRIADDIDSLEERVLRGVGPRSHRRILGLKRGIAAMRRIVGPQRDTVLALTRDEFRTIPADLRPYLRDVYDRLARVGDLLDSYRDEVAAMLELQVSMDSYRMNDVIKRLTVLATIGLPLTIVTSYYGMNLKLPEYEWAHGEWFALGLLGATALGTWLYLRWKRWD